ncbi:hypothetical protein LEP1GSC059_1784 [Leptospira noguchii serovar Panama str. CZ214]|uniref:Uncharacterized protein n=1 Tax=Leptospira noguchii serovar Panama str. CZ214 TaxID=1001595 RepID=T0FHB5_9LEPT|nr:hypothetical protein LEP1GSC059_1784 [Leptospira noguchii serovar Panama str. CZ214]
MWKLLPFTLEESFKSLKLDKKLNLKKLVVFCYRYDERSVFFS